MHGARVKVCTKEGCTNQVINRVLCTRHGARVKMCSCTYQAI
jgi:hypothetical protein